MERFDVVIIGGGPAGLSAALYASRAKLSTLVIERSTFGGRVAETALIENYPGFTSTSGPELAAAMGEGAFRFGAVPRADDVTAISASQDGGFTVTSSQGCVLASAVIVASGGMHRRLGVPGEAEFEGRGVSYCAICDGPVYEGGTVVVVGGGDSALQEALFLAEYAPSVTIVHRRQQMRASALLQERARQDPRIRFALGWVVDEIQGQDAVRSVLVRSVLTGSQESIPADGVFIYVGMSPCAGFLGDLVPSPEDGFLVTDPYMQTSLPGVFAAGDVRSKPFRQIATAVGEGTEAALNAIRFIRDGQPQR